MDPRLLAVADQWLPPGPVAVPSRQAVAALRQAGQDAVHVPLDARHQVRALALVDDELATAGAHAEDLLARVADALVPGGALLIQARSAVLPSPGGSPPGRTFDAEELRRLLGHHGFGVELLCAPGAADRVAGAGSWRYRPDVDRRPGLLDAGDLLVATGRLAADQPGRSAEFFATLPRKVVAAAVVCRDDRDRLLVVHDSFKGHWTIPGGVVDPDEDPQAGAIREAWEEAGVRVSTGPLLGVFAGSWPDRLLFVYQADSIGPPPAAPAAIHAHEIDAVAWVPQAEALERLAPHIRSQVIRCLEHPGRTWPASER